MPEAGFTPSAVGAEVTTVRINQTHLAACQVDHLEDFRHVTARVDLVRPQDGTGCGVQVSHLPFVGYSLVDRERTAVDDRAVTSMTCDDTIGSQSEVSIHALVTVSSTVIGVLQLLHEAIARTGHGLSLSHNAPPLAVMSDTNISTCAPAPPQ